MISPQFAAAQIARLKHLKRFPRHDLPAQFELAEALSRADDEAHAKRVIDEWMYDSTDAPTPADLYRIIEATAKPKVSQCEDCGGAGFLYSHNENGYGFVKRCRCRKPETPIVKNESRGKGAAQ